MQIKISIFTLLLLVASSCINQKSGITDTENTTETATEKPFLWENAHIYFLLTDRFNNGNTANDVNFGRTEKTAKLRGFMGGDLKGITQKIEAGYFNDLGVDAIWFTPVVEQVHGLVDEGTGATYGFHGYWTKDWTTLDPNFGTAEDLAEMIATAHKNGIRILMDVVANHTGPVTPMDAAWPESWVREDPTCTYKDLKTTVVCTLVDNLPDIKTEKVKASESVDLPPQLVEKWKQEGRYEQEIAELDAFFKRTGYPRTPRYYIIKWLIDFIKDYGIDGYRVDTVKHTEEDIWEDLRKEADAAFATWKQTHPNQVMDKAVPFYMVGEVYNYGISGGRDYDYGDQKIDFFDAFTSLINFEFKYDANKDYESIFTKYDQLLAQKLPNKTVVNYISSHDDGAPFDKARAKAMEAGTKLLLCPGSLQTYYGDETARSLTIAGTEGDATLRSFMNWEEIEKNELKGKHRTQAILVHWQKLGQFRQAHPAVGSGKHQRLSERPYVFSRTYAKGNYSDQVVVALDVETKAKSIPVADVFADGTSLKEYYSGQMVKVTKGMVTFSSDYDVVLLGR
ncbi:MAG: alpha-amylase family glycosyl hydrolase [Bacteroidota bacterium]